MIPRNPNRALVPNYRRPFYGPVYAGALGVAAKAAYNTGRYLVGKLRPTKYAKKAVTSTVQQKSANKAKRFRKLKKNAPLKKRVRNLERQVNKLDSKYVYRRVEGEQVTALKNEAGWFESVKSTPSGLESAFANLKYYDPATPGTLVTAGINSGTYSHDYRISAHSSINIRNNDLVPINVKLYLVKAKGTVSDTPLTLLDAGLVDNGGTAKTSTMIHLSDGDDMIKPYWTYKLVKDIRLMPGGEFISKYSTGEYDYDPAKFDTIAETYQPLTKTFAWVVRVQGVVAHDKTTTGNVGTIAAAADIIIKTFYSCKYNSGGASLYTIGVSDVLDTMAAGPVVSQVSMRNQEYSLAAV